MIGDRSQITYLELSELLDNDETFAQEALAVLARDYARPKSTYTAATSAMALLEKWVQRGELRCYNERGRVVTEFNPTLFRGDDDFQTALESVESRWLVDRSSFVQLVDRYGMTIPESVAYEPGPDATLLPNAFGYTADGAAHALFTQCGANEAKWRERILAAVRNGELRVRDPQDGAYIKPERVCSWIERIAIADLNEWLSESGAGYQLDEQFEGAKGGETKTSNGVVKNRIIGAFKVMDDAMESNAFWALKLKDPPDWLRGARLTSGSKGVSALWDPVLVASALLDYKPLSISVARLDSIMRSNFPKRVDEWLEVSSHRR